MDPLSIIGIVGGLIKAGEELFSFVQSERTRLQQTGEWTDAQEQAFLDLQSQRAQAPWQKPMDPPSAGTTTPPPAGSFTTFPGS